MPFCVVVKEDRPMSRVCLYVYMFRFTYAGITPVAGSIFRPLSQTHISKSELKNGHISILLCFQVIQVISSAKFFSAEEVGNEGTPPDFEPFFSEKRP